MKLRDLQILQCIECGGDLRLSRGAPVGDSIVDAALQCVDCAVEFPVVDRVGVFFKSSVIRHYLCAHEVEAMERLGMSLPSQEAGAGLNERERDQLAVSRNWEYQWQEVDPFGEEELSANPDSLYGERVFWRFIPIDPQSVRDKVVFIACGGRGREAFHVSRNEPAKMIVNEIGGEIYSIRRLLPQWEDRLLLIRSDICATPLRDSVADISICDHALQHVPDHRAGLASIVRSTKQGGVVTICVYSHENNTLMTHFVEPAKGLLHKLPLGAQRGVAFLPALAVYSLIHLVYVPLGHVSEAAAKSAPLGEHMLFWANNSFATVWMSCFDLIHAPVSYHFKKSEIENMARANRMKVETLNHTHGALWSLVAVRERPA